VSIYQDEKDKNSKNVTLRLSIASYEKTLKTEEVNNLLNKAAEAAKAKFGAERI
jgi:phenylalanyl-tRNA synthetase beta subunit